MIFSLESPSWEADAGCRGADSSLFFGPNHFEPKRDREAREAAAKTICQTCPAIVACRDHALAHEEAFGVWGGLGEAERRLLLERGRPMRRVG